MNLSSSDLVKDMARVGAKTLVKYTEPFGLTKGKVKDVMDDVIERDINKVYPNVGNVYSKLLQKKSKRLASAYVALINNGEMEKADKIAMKHLGFSKAGFDGGGYHEKQRKFGSIPKKPNYDSKAVTNQTVLASYVREKQKRSGLAKAGFIAALNDLGGGKWKPQAWLSKMASPSLGSAKVKGSGKGTKVTLINKVSYVHRRMKGKKLKRAMITSNRNVIKHYQKVIYAKSRKYTD